MASEQAAEPTQAHLSLWDAVSIIIGIVIGAGIYETAPFILFNTASPLWGLGAWALGGILSLIGALCYAELATTYPKSGGDYVYLSRAFGPFFGFMFGWAQLSVLMTGSIGMMAYIFADYAQRLWHPFGQYTAVAYAAAAVLLLSVINIAGVLAGKWTQNLLTLAKVLGLGSILYCGLFKSPSFEFLNEPAPKATGTFGLAMILILYTYGGWSDAAFVASEQRNRSRNIPLALILGTAGVMVIYLLVNLAYMSALGFEGARGANQIAAVVLEKSFGSDAANLMSVLVLISALGAINGMIFTGSRVYAKLGSEHRLFGLLGGWSNRSGSPVWALIAQMAITLLMVVMVGTPLGHLALNPLIGSLGFDLDDKWGAKDGFSTLLKCTGPVFWTLMILTGMALLRLREIDHDRPRPFRVPLYPLFPTIFLYTCGFMLYSALDYAGAKLAMLGFVPVLLGVPGYMISRVMGGRPPESGMAASE